MRVLAITGNASLVVALGSMMREWEVVTARNIDEALESVQGALVVLIDLGGTSSGVEVADQLYRAGITIPCVIIGDVEADHPRASILVRPFSLEDLGTAVKLSAERSTGPAARARPPAQPVEEQPQPPVTRTPPGERAKIVANKGGGPAAAAIPDTAGEAEKQTGRRGGLTVVRPQHESADEPGEESEERVAPEDPASEATPSDEPAEEPSAPSTADRIRSQLEETRTPEPEPEPESAFIPPPAAPSQQLPPAAPAARFEVPTATEPAQPAARWRRKRRAQPTTPVEETESPIVRRLRAAAGWAHEIESLLEEIPVLEDLWALADALVGEVETEFASQVAAVFAPSDDGFQALAHRGLSRVEAGMVVPDTQPLFSDVISTQEGILIQPVDLAQGLVSGIGGARTEAFMAAPVIVEGRCIAIVVVGGDRFAETDLDRLSDLANEAAPGLAVARLLQRLSGRDFS